jgi:hypothetical protein
MTVSRFEVVAAAPSSHETGPVSTAVEKERGPPISGSVERCLRHGRLGSAGWLAFLFSSVVFSSVVMFSVVMGYRAHGSNKSGNDDTSRPAPSMRIQIQFKPPRQKRTAPEAVEMAEVSL